MKSRWLTLAEDSAVVHCGYEQAGNLLVERPSTATPDTEHPVDPPVALAAEFELDPAQVQDLADRVSDLQTASAGYTLRFRLTPALNEDTPAEVRAAVDRLLNEILTGLPPDQ